MVDALQLLEDTIKLSLDAIHRRTHVHESIMTLGYVMRYTKNVAKQLPPQEDDE